MLYCHRRCDGSEYSTSKPREITDGREEDRQENGLQDIHNRIRNAIKKAEEVIIKKAQ